MTTDHRSHHSADARRRRRPIRGVAIAVVAALLSLGLLGAAAAEPSPSGWLAGQVANDGSVLDPYSSEPSIDWAVNVALALAAAGDQPEALGRAMTLIEANVEEYIVSGTSDATGHISWLILLAVATDRDPRQFGETGVDLVVRLTSRFGVAEVGLFGTVDAYTPVTNQSLAILALVAAGEPVDEGATDWLLSQQCTAPTGQDGAWQGHRAIVSGSLVDCLPTTSTDYGRPESASTSYAVQALVALRESGYRNSRLDDSVTAALGWLRDLQSTSGPAIGGFGQYVGDIADPNSTAVVILALAAAGVDPSTLNVGSEDPFTSLSSWIVQTGPDAGAVSSPYSAGAADLFATFQAMWGIVADPWPILPTPTEAVTLTPEVLTPAYTG